MWGRSVSLFIHARCTIISAGVRWSHRDDRNHPVGRSSIRLRSAGGSFSSLPFTRRAGSFSIAGQSRCRIDLHADFGDKTRNEGVDGAYTSRKRVIRPIVGTRKERPWKRDEFTGMNCSSLIQRRVDDPSDLITHSKTPANGKARQFSFFRYRGCFNPL